jgi:hypothetical protein
MPSRENISETSRQIGRGLLVPTLRMVITNNLSRHKGRVRRGSQLMFLAK